MTIISVEIVVVYHSFCTLPTRCIKTHHVTAPSITPHPMKNYNFKDIKHYQLLTYIYITCIILSEIIIYFFKLLWSDDTTNHIVHLYSCNNFTLKMAAIATETCW
jgi:hypothetical protein